MTGAPGPDTHSRWRRRRRLTALLVLLLEPGVATARAGHGPGKPTGWQIEDAAVRIAFLLGELNFGLPHASSGS